MTILLDGIDDFISIPDSNDFNFGSGNFTIVGWIKLDNLIGSKAIYSQTNNDPFNRFIFYAFNDELAVFLKAGGVDEFDEKSGSHLTTSWQHVALRRSGNSWDLFVDGDSKLNFSYSGSVPNLPADVLLGKQNLAAGTVEFSGLFNDFSVWKTDLSDAEINQLYNSRIKYLPLQIKAVNLMAYWPMDDGANGTSADGDTVRDLSGNGNNGTGDDGANNTGLTWQAEGILSYLFSPISVEIFNAFPTVDAGADKYVFHYGVTTPLSDATFSDPDGTVDHAYIDVNGGGFIEIEQGTFATLQDAVQAYLVKFPTVGAIIVTLQVEDDGGRTSQDTMTMNVLTVSADDVIEIDGIKYDVVDSVNWDIEDHHLKIPVIKRV
jgi:hypothetical protein